MQANADAQQQFGGRTAAGASSTGVAGTTYSTGGLRMVKLSVCDGPATRAMLQSLQHLSILGCLGIKLKGEAMTQQQMLALDGSVPRLHTLDLIKTRVLRSDTITAVIAQHLTNLQHLQLPRLPEDARPAMQHIMSMSQLTHLRFTSPVTGLQLGPLQHSGGNMPVMYAAPGQPATVCRGRPSRPWLTFMASQQARPCQDSWLVCGRLRSEGGRCTGDASVSSAGSNDKNSSGNCRTYAGCRLASVVIQAPPEERHWNEPWLP